MRQIKVLQRPLRVQKDARRCSVEGLVYGGFPGLAKKLAGEVLSMPENTLRVAGLIAIAVGVGLVWLVHGG
ncbi:MAG: DUF2065 family protein [Mesorhizobium sp.]|uniref:DUF2065 domain-containing protein n=1 Tax=Mesorhizobium sp. TaxID=1871066 RepID=UPI0012019ADC|nr:DUF2065 family protein [Mesorhizobium sp.]TIL87445.1 MAG: DUF2065 family protein [Mesorhizobium sp.]